MQRSRHARTDLISLGVPDAAIGSDRLRAFGRGAVGLPDGSATPCVFARTATAGSVRTSALGQVLGGTTFAAQLARLDALRHTLTGIATRDCIPECYPRCAPLATCSPQVPPALVKAGRS